MAKVYLVSCVKSKLAVQAPARDLYVSAWFRKARAIADREGDRWYVLSAEHGLVAAEKMLAPYDKTLTGMSPAERRKWASGVVEAISRIADPSDELVFLAVAAYRRDVVPALRELGFHSIEEPLEGLRQGEQLQWLTRELSRSGGSSVPVTQDRSRSDPVDPEDSLEHFYELLDRLAAQVGGRRVLGECTGQLEWPDRGVYFMSEPGEVRSDCRFSRVVRVGTHGLKEGSKSTLWARLRQHRGYLDGRGNHRVSILRSHVGLALRNRDGRTRANEHWGEGSSAPRAVRQAEAEWERRVSRYLARVGVLWLDVGDDPGPDSARGEIERGAIGLLSTVGRQVDPPGESWLGWHAEAVEIRESGLWNVQHVGEPLDPRFLSLLERYVDLSARGQGT